MRKTADHVVAQIPRLRRYARALTGDAVEADDLVQECLARALSRLTLWRAGSDMRAWLFTIMHNLYVNDCRKEGSRPPSFPLHEVPERAQIGAEPEQALRLDDLESALRTLPGDQREVVLLVSLEGLSYRQVAKALDVPIGTVMSRLHRGRARLSIELFGEAGDLPGLRSVK
jgi:RNA polymerase sigma-70 factor (ECF subfamily)